MKDDNYVVIQGWMVNRLNLKANELLIFATIYGFSQDGESYFTGSLKYLCEITSATRMTVMNALKSLVEKKYIVKEELYINGVKFAKYKINLGVVKKLYGGWYKNYTGGGIKIIPNNIDNNIDDNIDIYEHSQKQEHEKQGIENHIVESEQKNKKFVKPTIDEVREYCKERGNKVDFERFYNYYESNGWKVGKNPMQNWKACVRTWERSVFNEKQNKNTDASYDIDEWTEKALNEPLKYESKKDKKT